MITFANVQRRYRGFISWAQAHDRVLSFIGATVVLLTFVAQDHKRDYFREIVSSIDDAQTAVLTRNALNTLQTQLILLPSTISPFRQGNNQPIPSEVADAQSRLGQMMLVRQSGEMNLSSIAAMLVRAPMSNKTSRKLRKLQDRSEQMGRELFAFSQTLSRTRTPVQGMSTAERMTPEMANHFLRIEEKASTLSVNVADFVVDTLKESDKTREAGKKSLTFWSHVCDWLFLVGWLLGLVGKLAGIDVAPKGD